MRYDQILLYEQQIVWRRAFQFWKLCFGLLQEFIYGIAFLYLDYKLSTSL